MIKLKRVLTIMLTLILLSGFNEGKDKSYIGKWKGRDNGDVGYLTLTKDRYATFEFSGEIMGGRSYNHSGTHASLRYKINTKKDPHEINFIIWDKKKAEEAGRMQGIFRMIDDNKMQMSINFSGSSGRPTDFSTDTILFYRVTE